MNASRLMFPSLLLCLLFAALTPAFAIEATYRVSVSSGQAQGNGTSAYASVSADGRFVAFQSFATNLVPGDMNASGDVFVRDRLLGTTERVSVRSDEAEANDHSYNCSISADGTYVAFQSDATNLVPADNNACEDVFVRDRLLGTTERVSVSSDEVEGDWGGDAPSVSADGRYVAFSSHASNLVSNNANGYPDVFVRDRLLGTTERVSVSSEEVEGDYGSFPPSITADGRYVAFHSYATNLVPDDTNHCWDVFVRDRLLGTTERVSVSSDEVEGNKASSAASISADGTYVAFESLAANLVLADTNDASDVFVRDRELGTTERVSVSSDEVEANNRSYSPSISAVGRYVAFKGCASNLVPDDTDMSVDVFVRDRVLGTTERVSVSTGGAQADDCCGWPSINADGTCVAFNSAASTLVLGDTNGCADVFVRGPALAPQALLELHPNEQAPGAAGPLLGDPYWTAPAAGSTGSYTWKTYNFGGGPYLWIQICAQAQRASNTPSLKPDRLQMLVDGVLLSDYWADNMAAPPNWQWHGNFALDMGRRKTLRFLSMGVPGVHTIRFKAVQYPIIWWIRVTDLEPQVIEAPG